MESADLLQRRIDTLNELHTIVKTMKTLSQVNIRQYEQAVKAQTDYYRTIELGLHVVLKDMQRPPAPIQRKDKASHRASIIFGSDHGLCGRFNEDITRYALEQIEAAGSPQEHHILAIGSRAAAALQQSDQQVEHELLLPGSAAFITVTVQKTLMVIDSWREQGNVQQVQLIYNRHLSGGGYQPTTVELLPVDMKRFHRLEAAPWPSRRLPTFTMERKQLLATLLRQYFFVSIFRACAESQASEHASRLAAMHSAEKNLDERREEVTSLFHRLRQDAITNELLDVVSGFEAVMHSGRPG
jgi:F-type H+-transporting ATPase subunit gamma